MGDLPPLPEGKYQWWDDYYDGLTLSQEPEARYEQMGLYDEDQMQAYARAAVAQERERCARICEELMPQNDPSDWTELAKTNAETLGRAAAAIRADPPGGKGAA